MADQDRYADALDALLAGEHGYGPGVEAPHEPPPIKDVEGANRLVRWRARAVANKEGYEAAAAAEIARVKAKLADLVAGEQRIIDLTERSLEGWTRANWRASGSGNKRAFKLM